MVSKFRIIHHLVCTILQSLCSNNIRYTARFFSVATLILTMPIDGASLYFEPAFVLYVYSAFCQFSYLSRLRGHHENGLRGECSKIFVLVYLMDENINRTNFWSWMSVHETVGVKFFEDHSIFEVIGFKVCSINHHRPCIASILVSRYLLWFMIWFENIFECDIIMIQ